MIKGVKSADAWLEEMIVLQQVVCVRTGAQYPRVSVWLLEKKLLQDSHK